MFNTRGGFSGQRPMGPPRMNQPPMNHHGMNMSGMNMPSMNMPSLGMSSIRQPSMNIGSINPPPMNPSLSRGGLLGMNPGMGLANLNPPPMNVNRMGLPGMNQGGMGFQTELKSQGFNLRPMDSPGSFLGGNTDPMVMKSIPLRAPMHSAPPSLPPHFPSPTGPMTPAPPRMGLQSQDLPIMNRVLGPPSDHLLGKVNPALQDTAHIMKEKIGAFGSMSQDMGMKPSPLSSLDPMSNTQKRYTNESASSILQSFGLSNEDLEELSRYPDDQLTPMNLPNILRDIRLRKGTRPAVVPDQAGRGRRPGEVVPSKVIDYGHSSKYQIDNPSSHPFEPLRTDQKPTVSKEPIVSKNNQTKTPTDHVTDNKIPTISLSRKQASWQTPISNRSNSKTMIGERAIPKAADGSVNVLTAKSPVTAIKPEPKSLMDVPVNLDTSAVGNSKVNTRAPIGQGSFLSSPEAPAPGRASWGPSQNQEDAQKGKWMPTPSMMNDYFASSPRIFPHICSLCNIECRHLKDWIKHQNNTAHIENCRKLCQQYPDWNPQIHTSSGTDIKNEGGPNKSRSKSRSPRRPRRSDSRHRPRRSRSRSPRPSGRRSRSRSPRWSRPSPGKSRSPHRAARSPLRSQSPRRYRSARSRSSPDKRAVDTAVHNFIEASKLKSGERGRAAKPSSDVKKTSSNVRDKNSTSPSKNSSSSNNATRRPSSSSNHSNSSKKPESSSSNSSLKKSSSSSSATRRPLSANRRTTPSSLTSKKPVVSTGAKKTTASISVGKKMQPSNPPVGQKDHARPPPSESCSILNKFSNKECSKKIIHVTNLPDSGYTDQDILKIVQPFGKVCDILIVRSKNEAFVETNFKEAAAAAIKYGETVPVMINNKVITLSAVGQKNDPPGAGRRRPFLQKRPGKPEVQLDKKPEPKKTEPKKPETKTPEPKNPEPKTPSDKELKSKEQTAAPSKEQEDKSECSSEKKPLGSKDDTVVPPGFIKVYKLVDPPYTDAEKCVIVLSNLPEKPSSVDEISNLAKPFGGVNNIIVISNHRKAYLELTNKTSVDSMLKFYDVFPVYLSGSLLKISAATKFKNLKDENRIFLEIIEEAQYKIHPTIYERFVHVLNLPEKDLEDFDVFKIGLRFGQVKHYAVFSNKRKAILHMDSASTARAMCRFLYQYPATIGGSVVKCLPARKPKLAENEYSTSLEEEKESSDQTIATLTPDEVEDETQKKIDVKEKTDMLADVKENTSKQADAKEKTVKQADAKEKTVKQADAKGKTVKQADAKGKTVKQADAKGKTVKQADVEEKTSKEAKVKEKVGLQDDFKEKMDKQDGQIAQLDSLTQGSEMDVVAAGGLAKSSSVLSQCEDEDMEYEEEEAAEAPEAPESSSFIFIQPEPISSKEYNTNPQVYVSEESDVLVSVESDEECETQVPTSQNATPLTCSTKQKAARVSDDCDIEESPNDIPCDLELETAGDSQKSSSQDHEAARNEESDSGADSSEVPRSTRNHAVKGGPGGSSVRAEDSDKESKSSNTSRKGSSNRSEQSKEGRDRARHSSHTRSRDEAGRASDLALTRTAKYHPQRGDISITLTVDSQKSSSRTDPRKRPSGERGCLGRDGSTPKSSSNRSSPSENASSNSKVTSYQTKSTSRGVASRSREIDTRSSNRKDDRSKGGSSSSSRYPRSSKGSSRGPRSKDEEDTCPINLDEYVTVDEIVEEQRDSYSKADDGQKSQTAGTPKRGKRKENYPPSALDAKKARGAQELSFLTLDEVGDDDNSAATADTSRTQKDKSLLAGKVYAEDGLPTDKESQVLVTLDEISDDEDVATSVKQPPTSAMLSKDQLLTLDEVSAEDEEKTSHSEPSKPKRQPRQKKGNKEEKIRSESEAKENLGSTDAPKAATVQGRPPEQPLLTLDEIKGDDDDEEAESIGDMEHRFFTVDEVGEDEEDLETQENAEKSRSGSIFGQHSNITDITASQNVARRRAGRRRRRRKHPLADTTDYSKDLLEQPSASESEKTPVKPKAKTFRGSIKGEESTTPNKSEADVSTSDMETPAKKTKLDSPASGGTKPSSFSASDPVGMGFLVPKTGYFCELCSLFYMDLESKLKHCKSQRHQQAVQKHLAEEEETEELEACST